MRYDSYVKRNKEFISSFIRTLLDQRLLKYSSGKVLGFPGTEPPDLALEIINYINKFNPNAILLHYYYKYNGNSKSEKEAKAFKIIHDFERAILYWLEHLLHNNDKTIMNHVEEEIINALQNNLSLHSKQRVWGYITTGGTESNIYALWLARNYFSKKGKRIQIIVPWIDATHYSIFKGLNILGLSKTDGNGIERSANANIFYIPLTKDGDIDTEYFESKILSKIEKDKPTIIVLSAPSINTGIVDNYEIVDKVRDKIRDERLLWIHIDGAYGMMILPFLKDYNNIDSIIYKNYNAQQNNIERLFFNYNDDYYKSISIDPHKTGYMAYPIGAILVKEPAWSDKPAYEYISRRVTYVAGEKDFTLTGSRTAATIGGFLALILWLGYDGYSRLVSDLLDRTSQLLEFFDSNICFHVIGKPVTTIFSIAINNTNECCTECWRKVINEYIIVDTSLSLLQKGKELRIWRFSIMPHVLTDNINKFKDYIRYCYDSCKNKR